MECSMPKIGPETKKQIREIYERGWKNIQLLWEAEDTWFTPQDETQKPYEKTRLWVVSEEIKGRFRLLGNIPNRNL